MRKWTFGSTPGPVHVDILGELSPEDMTIWRASTVAKGSKVTAGFSGSMGAMDWAPTSSPSWILADIVRRAYGWM